MTLIYLTFTRKSKVPILVNSRRADGHHSCFPIVPKLACQYLDIPCTTPTKPITLLGGLTSFGGAGNNYSMHVGQSLDTSPMESGGLPLTHMLQALTAMVRKLRAGDGQNGLILANGGVLTYQHALCLSNRPRRDGCTYPDRNALSGHRTWTSVPTVTVKAEGEAMVEVSPSCAFSDCYCIYLIPIGQTYTVEFSRNGTPSKGFIVGRLTGSDHRFVANTGNAKTLEQLSNSNSEPIGRVGWVRSGDSGRNLFVRNANL